jgi:hypothetical protein
MTNAFWFADRIERNIDRVSGSPTFNQDGLAEGYAGMTANV